MVSDQATAIADIGVAGLAVMGANLARNLARHGYRVALYNRSIARTRSLAIDHGHEGVFVPTESIRAFVASLRRPRAVLVMVQAGAGTDAVISQLAEELEPGDIIVDCGNAHFPDTIRRTEQLAARGLHFVGAGVSGGEEGALTGPAIMVGGTDEAYATVGPILERIAAQVDQTACCAHVGPDGAGHYVKMVHNGIEYADMQLIAEAYDLLRRGVRLSAPQAGLLFGSWNTGELESYLIEVAAEVLAQEDPATGRPLVDLIVDQAAQKGTGRWTVQSALDLGVPVTGIAEATFARALSGSVRQREAARAAGLPAAAQASAPPDADAFIEDVRQALYASKIIAYSQGFDQLAAASERYRWGIDLGTCASLWRGGCIIRARFLDRITEAYRRTPDLPMLLVDPFFAEALGAALPALRRVVAQAALAGVPAPAFAASLAYYDAVRSARLPADLIQAQRDYFGAHTYRRIDQPGDFHLLWSGDRSEVHQGS
jgi:6-phosphogluconate dehydrogenase